MPFARVIAHAAPADLEPAFDRMALPRSARDYLLEKVPSVHVLLTGLERHEGRFLRALAEEGEAPGHEAHPLFVTGDQRHRPGTALLSGRVDQLDRLLRRAKDDEALEGLAGALEAALRGLRETPPALTLGERTFTFGGRPWLMGIVNVTPDSFSDGGRYFDVVEAVAQGTALARAGADLLDVGGESTRPGAPEVDEQEELRRVVPVIEALRERTSLPISIDTRKAHVARAALAAGATLVNDVSGFRHDPEILQVAAKAGAAVCAMHIQGTPETMARDPRYEDLMEDVVRSLSESVERAVAAGIPRERALVDPGIGFGKTFAHNHFLLRRLGELRVLGQPVLVGHSRKAFLGALSGGKPPEGRVLATAACAAAIAITGGADFLRVHDPAEVKEALLVAEAIRTARDGGALFGS